MNSFSDIGHSETDHDITYENSQARERTQILMDVARQNSKVRTDPAPRVRFRLLGSSSIDFELLCWVEEPSLKGLVSHELLKDIYTALNREDISIPFPQMDVYLKKTDDPAQ